MTDKPVLTFPQKIAKSTQVLDVQYKPETQELLVVFKGTRFVYAYQDFPADKWAELQAADSIGSWLYKNVTKKDVAWAFEKTPITDADFDKLVALNIERAATIPAEA